MKSKSTFVTASDGVEEARGLKLGDGPAAQSHDNSADNPSHESPSQHANPHQGSSSSLPKYKKGFVIQLPTFWAAYNYTINQSSRTQTNSNIYNNFLQFLYSFLNASISTVFASLKSKTDLSNPKVRRRGRKRPIRNRNVCCAAVCLRLRTLEVR